MKPSYKLIGLFWDRRPVPKEIPNFSSFRGLLNYSYPYEIFDQKYYERKIDLSELLDASSEEMIQRILDKVKLCDRIAINIDIKYHYFHPVFVNFIVKRALQVYKFLKENLGETCVYFMAGTRFGKAVVRAIKCEFY